MQPERRSTPDVAGRPVDLYPANYDATLSAMALDAESISMEILRDSVVAAMREICEIARPRLRDRIFPIYLCKWKTYGNEFIGVGLPDRFPQELYRIFGQHINEFANIIEHGVSLAVDVGARPAFLYERGKVIIYVDPFAADDPESDGLEVEFRSMEFKPAKRPSPRRQPLPRVRDDALIRHSIDTWDSLRLDIMRFTWETIYTGTFFALRTALRRQFGIAVRVVPTAQAGKYGSICTDWITASDGDCAVTIYVSKDLPNELKYVVLAHELAHYALHYPVILSGQLAEQASWAIPHYECFYRDSFSSFFGDGRKLEDQADSLATHLLIPPQYNLDLFAQEKIWQAGRPVSVDEIIWAYLGEYFPERSSEQYTFRNIEDMYEHAEQEVSWGRSLNDLSEGTLYRKMLHATLGRESEAAVAESQRMSESVHRFWDQVCDGFGQVLGGELPPCTAQHDHFSSFPRLDIVSSGRKLLDPLTGSNVDACRIPLVPLSPGRKSGKWLNVLQPSGKAELLADWQKWYPDHAAVLYPTRRPPTAPAFGIVVEP